MCILRIQNASNHCAVWKVKFSRSLCGRQATSERLVKTFCHRFCPKLVLKNLNTLSCWSTLRSNKPSGRQAFRRAFEKTALSFHDQWLKETQRQRSEEQESECPQSLSWRNHDARP